MQRTTTQREDSSAPAAYAYLDVTGSVDCTDPQAVRAVAESVLQAHHPEFDLQPLRQAFADLEDLYEGRYPGYCACDMAYHDLPHVLDVSLALIRLVDGYQKSHQDALRLSAELCFVAITVSLFHDSGYIRRQADRRRRHGAEYTRIHVTRSGRFLRAYLKANGFADYAALAARLVQFTGYEVDLSRLRFADPRKRRLGELIGTADILAQMSDRFYLDKCRDRLYPEFVMGGMTRRRGADGRLRTVYRDELDLLRKTPEFIDAALGKRLGESFHEAWRYVEVHFGGRNPYFEAIGANRERLLRALRENRQDTLRQPFQPGWDRQGQ